MKSSTQTLKTSGVDCVLHTWNLTENPKAIIVIYHGLLAHAQYPTVRYLAELLAKNNYAVFALDMPGHGLSPGTRGYIFSADALINHGLDAAEFAWNYYNKDRTNHRQQKMFLCGSSMGGTIASMTAQKKNARFPVDGVVLLAPMLKLSSQQPMTRYLLKGLAYLFPKAAVIPSSSSSGEKQYRDPIKRKEADEDELSISGNLRLASASTCLELCSYIADEFENISFPVLVLVADEDVVVNNTGATELMEKAKSEDKTAKHYKALHGLLCEPEPLINDIEADILEWISVRCS